MNDNFNYYSTYYDLLYADKDYDAEVSYIRTLINEYTVQPTQSLLELGCGTGIHACALAKQGINVLAIDISANMLIKARLRKAELSADHLVLDFDQGDVKNFRAIRKFDVVTSLFHVLSYQTSDSDIRAMMVTASTHLDSGGLFIFDFWYGPAVLWQQPSVRIKRFANADLNVTRIAEPTIHDHLNVVNVKYSIHVKELSTLQKHDMEEIHKMRYFFLPEINRLLSDNGFDQLLAEEWLTRKSPSVDTWGVCVVARKRKL